MGIERRQKRKQQQDVKKMYDKQMKLMSTMTEAQRVTHLAHLQSRLKPAEQNNGMVQTMEPMDVI